jgi:hypothetical protein
MSCRRQIRFRVSFTTFWCIVECGSYLICTSTAQTLPPGCYSCLEECFVSVTTPTNNYYVYTHFSTYTRAWDTAMHNAPTLLPFHSNYPACLAARSAKLGPTHTHTESSTKLTQDHFTPTSLTMLSRSSDFKSLRAISEKEPSCSETLFRVLAKL